jgi:hypothetical protein
MPINITLIGITTLMVLLRLYARFKTKTARLDDWLVILALPPAIALAVTIGLLAEHHGFNKHIWDFDGGVNGVNLVEQRRVEWASEMLYLWSSSLTKLSLLVFYNRIFVSSKLRIFTNAFTYFVIGYFVAFFLALLFQCRPLDFYWNSLASQHTSTAGECTDEGMLLLVSGVLNVFIDVVILILPIPTVLKLKIRWTQKLQVLAVFLAGLLVVATSSTRITATLWATRGTYDVTWAGYLVWMWIGIEVDVGLICASVPACKSLFKSWQKKLDSSRTQPGRRSRPSAHRYSNNKKSNLKDTNDSISGSYLKMVKEGKIHQRDLPENWMASSNTSTTLSSRRWSTSDEEEFDLEFLADSNSPNILMKTPEPVLYTVHE